MSVYEQLRAVVTENMVCAGDVQEWIDALHWLGEELDAAKQHGTVRQFMEDNGGDGQPDEAQEWHDYDPDC